MDKRETKDDLLAFADRNEFRSWLGENCTSSGGVWLLFGKKGGPQTLSAVESLEEALCFGWIDGQMQRIDDKSYKKFLRTAMSCFAISKRTREKRVPAMKPVFIAGEYKECANTQVRKLTACEVQTYLSER